MVRSRNRERFGELVRAAVRVFIRRGYRLTQMSDVASEAGMAKGTLYLYVTSKEALFDLAVRHADRDLPLQTPPELPLGAPDQATTLAHVQARLADALALPVLRGAVAATKAKDPNVELRAVVAELYDLLFAQRNSLKLVDRCAQSYPALGAIYFQMARIEVPGLLSRYLEVRAASGQLREHAHPQLAVRTLIEVLAFWAVHVHWDESTPEIDPDEARASAIEFLVGAYRAP